MEETGVRGSKESEGSRGPGREAGLARGVEGGRRSKQSEGSSGPGLGAGGPGLAAEEVEGTERVEETGAPGSKGVGRLRGPGGRAWAAGGRSRPQIPCSGEVQKAELAPRLAVHPDTLSWRQTATLRAERGEGLLSWKRRMHSTRFWVGGYSDRSARLVPGGFPAPAWRGTRRRGSKEEDCTSRGHPPPQYYAFICLL